MTAEPLSPQDRAAALAGLPSWHYDPERKALFRKIVTADFVAAFGLMTRIAIVAESADHHPEWGNVYNRIYIWLTTHEADGVSMRDIRLARQIDAFANIP